MSKLSKAGSQVGGTSIKHWQAQERPREKLLNFGAASLSDAELLAIFLRTGVAGQNAVELARELLRDSGGLLSLLGAERHDFCSRKGLGLAKYVQLQAVLETARRCLQEKMQRQNVLGSPQATRDFLRLKLAPSQHEIFACLYLDSQNQLLRYEELSSGTLDGATVYPREVIKRVLANNAASVIFAHNHPSGIAEPSEADRHITQRLQKALSHIDVRVLDHLVIGSGEMVSFAEQGLL